MSTNNKNFSSIPILDMQDIVTHSPQSQEQLQHACHQVGFFYLRNHGVSSHLTDKILSLTNQFFLSTQADKNAIDITYSKHFRGYGKLNAEITEGIPDYKETYDLGLERQPIMNVGEKPHLALIGPNQWPEAPPLRRALFKETILDYMHIMQDLGKKLMDSISALISANPSELAAKFNPDSPDAYAMLRLLHYPPSQHATLGVGPHIDSGCLILLLQDNVGGLQVKNNLDEWIDVPPIPNTFVINLGEMLQIWTEGYLKATTHRVINQTAMRRISAPFFFEPNLATIIPKSTGTSGHYGERMLEIFNRSFTTNKRAQ